MAGVFPDRCQSHHHRGQALIAGGNADDAFAGRQRTDETTQHDGGIVAKRQRIQHAGGALRAAIAGISASAGKGNGAHAFQLARCFRHQQSHFPVSRVEAECDGFTVCGAQATVRAEDEKLGIEKSCRVPTHAGTLGQTEEISRGLCEQHLCGQWQKSGRARRMGGDAVEVGVGCLQNGGE